MLVEFLHTIDLDTTVVLFSSDHGLHYGPSFSSNGERERAEPILYLHIPPSNDGRGSQLSALKKNQDLWVTPLDVHETVLDATLQRRRSNRLGTSLLQPLSDDRKDCSKTPGIPQRFCSLLNPTKKQEKKCTFMSEPPSIQSFYADIPKQNKLSWPKCVKEEKIADENLEACLCSTNHPKRAKHWLRCDDPEYKKMKRQRIKNQDPLSMKTCKVKGSSKYTMEIDIDVKRRSLAVQRSQFEFRSISYKAKLDMQKRNSKKTKKGGGELRKKSHNGEIERLPNILFIEIDSLSQSAASRHMPKTLAFLKSHQIINDKENGISCPTGFCAANFNKTSVMGQNSIPNQLAALSGCTDRNMTNIDSYMREQLNKGMNGTLTAWCPKSSLDNPWLYNYLGKMGYITFFGEEFCYTTSPWVVQSNLFKLNPDLHMNPLFCRLATAHLIHNEVKTRTPLHSVEYDTPDKPQPCVDGRSKQEIGFEYIRGTWDAYYDEPKFAYLNSLAAHDYSIDLAYQSLGIEAYDEYLSKFLYEMLQRKDASDTIIVLRSDHGIQGGTAPIDFSAQVEHMAPFNNLIVPEKFRGSSWLQNLYANQDKLVTGYDLYNTIRGIVRPHYKGGAGPVKGYDNGIPEWSYNLLSDVVPDDRTCEEAKIPVDFCPCLEERTDLMPYFYVGHSEKLDEMRNSTQIQSGLFPGVKKIDTSQSTASSNDDNGIPVKKIYEGIAKKLRSEN